MFVGSVPRGVVNQLVGVADIKKNDSVFVCCSGSFRVDLAIKERFPKASVSGNDISLLSCAVGQLLVGDSLPFSFTGDLEFMEEELKGATPVQRIAAISVALELSRYNKKTEYGRKHIEYYRRHFMATLEDASSRVTKAYGERRIDSFHMEDFREQARRAIEADGFVVAFPPTYKGGYERMYKRVDENTQWDRPGYGVWDPAEMEAWLAELRATNTRHCVFVDRELQDLAPMAKFSRPQSHPIYLYGLGARGSSLRVQAPKSTAFRYTPIEPDALTEGTRVDLVPVPNEYFNFLRNRYLAKGIQFVDGMFNYLVLLDGAVAGGFSLARMNTGDPKRLYLLSDFSIRRERKLAKLIAMIAATRAAVHQAERKMFLHIDALVTTVFTNRPVSMKYRGIYKLKARKPGFLQYERAVSDDSPSQIYSQWWRKYS